VEDQEPDMPVAQEKTVVLAAAVMEGMQAPEVLALKQILVEVLATEMMPVMDTEETTTEVVVEEPILPVEMAIARQDIQVRVDQENYFLPLLLMEPHQET
tara:strand:+ start:420 stop:719 length:300 start_codon:yes stop_codon:yes gene_type:complete